jgi:hypothetical protein
MGGYPLYGGGEYFPVRFYRGTDHPEEGEQHYYRSKQVEEVQGGFLYILLTTLFISTSLFRIYPVFFGYVNYYG